MSRRGECQHLDVPAGAEVSVLLERIQPGSDQQSTWFKAALAFVELDSWQWGIILYRLGAGRDICVCVFLWQFLKVFETALTPTHAF